MKRNVVERKEGKLFIHSEKEILSMCIFTQKGNCLLSQENPRKELEVNGVKESLLVVLNFIGGDYLTTMVI